MKSIKVLFVLFILFFPFSGFAQEDDRSEYVYFYNNDCIKQEIEGLNFERVVLQNDYKKENKRLAECVYKKDREFITTVKEIYLKYQSTNFTRYKVYFFKTEQEAESFLNELKIPEDHKVISVEKEVDYFKIRGERYETFDDDNPLKYTKLIQQKGNFVIEAVNEIYFLPLRSYQLNKNISDSRMDIIVKGFGDATEFPNVPNKVLAYANELYLQKKKAFDFGDEILKSAEQKEKESDALNKEYMDRKSFWSKSMCLIFDGLGFGMGFLEKIGINDPYKTCAHILYKDVIETRLDEIPDVKWEAFLDSYEANKDWCMKKDLKGTFYPVLKDFKTKKIIWKIYDLEFCKKSCVNTEQSGSCI